jgi:hypothetical protein
VQKLFLLEQLMNRNTTQLKSNGNEAGLAFMGRKIDASQSHLKYRDKLRIDNSQAVHYIHREYDLQKYL